MEHKICQRELGAPLFMDYNRRRTVQNVYGSVSFFFGIIYGREIMYGKD